MIDWLTLFWVVFSAIGWAIAGALYARLRLTQEELEELALFILFKENADKEVQ